MAEFEMLIVKSNTSVMMFVDLIHTTESCTAWLYVRNE